MIQHNRLFISALDIKILQKRIDWSNNIYYQHVRIVKHLTQNGYCIN